MTTNRYIMEIFDSWTADINAHNALSWRDETENMQIADKTVEAERLAASNKENEAVVDVSVSDGGFSHKMAPRSVGAQIQQLRMRDINNERGERVNPDMQRVRTSYQRMRTPYQNTRSRV